MFGQVGRNFREVKTFNSLNLLAHNLKPEIKKKKKKISENKDRNHKIPLFKPDFCVSAHLSGLPGILTSVVQSL